MKALLGKKLGMTQVFKDDGTAVTVSVIECGPCTVMQKKTVEKDGYSSIQIGYQDKKNKKSNKAELGHAKKAGQETVKKYLQEVLVPENSAIEVGSQLTVAQFQAGEDVKVTGTSIGKGFQGTVKRYNFSIGPKSHGSKQHRNPGSIAAGTGRSNVFKGKKQPGRMGGEQVTIRGLKIVEVLSDQNVILVSGAIPGPKNGLVVVNSLQTEYIAENKASQENEKK
jgi:large subunit ribosomal protein L3